jgi:GT2 family glycosyltransferase
MISIVIPNYNGRFLLEDCLESVFKNSHQPKEIIVVDNGSTDDSVAYLKLNHKKVKIIRNKKNLGFATAVNQGIKKADQAWVAVINNDVFLDRNWLKVIYRQIKNKKSKISCYCGKVLNKTGKKIEGKGLKFFIFGKAVNIDNNQINKPYRENKKLVFGSSGAAVVYNKSIFKKIGYFDNDFFAYLEDVDLSLRMQKAGLKTVYLPKAVCFHKGQQTSNKIAGFRQKMVFQNWIYIIIKHYPLKTVFKNMPLIFLERLKLFYELVANTPVSRLSNLIIIFFEIMLKSPRMMAKRDPLEDKLLESLSKQ